MSNFKAAFEEFKAELADHISSDDSLTTQDEITMGKIWARTNEFIRTYNLAGDNFDDGLNKAVAATESLSDTFTNDVGAAEVISFCKSCDLPSEMIHSAAESLSFVLQNDKNHQSPSMFLESPTVGDEVGTGTKLVPANQYLSGRSFQTHVSDFSSALEEFGKNTDTIQSDLRWTIAVTILKYHKGVMDRLMHRKNAPENVVRFPIVGGEVFDLNETNRTLSSNRNIDNVGTPFIDLYKDPSPVNSTPKPVIPLKDNDTGSTPVLLEDGIMKFGTDVHTLDLSMKDQVGYDALDYSDMVADGVTFKNFYVKITKDNGSDPNVTEAFKFDFSNRPSGRFLMPMVTRHSAERRCNLNETVGITAETPTQTGSDNTIFADINGDYVVDLDVRIDGEINLSTGITNCRVAPKLTLRSKTGAEIPTAIKTEFNKLKIEINDCYYDLNEYFSEENVRKSSTVIKSVTGSLAYELPLSKNILVDFSIQETRPEQAMDLVAEALSIGCDARGVDIIIDKIKTIHDRIKDEEINKINTNQRTGVRYDYAAGLRVNPNIHMSNFDVKDHVETTRTGQVLGDIRSALDKYFLEIFSLMHSNSLYTRTLNPGEKTVYRICTSNVIKENIFQIPHYHNHLNTDGAQDGGDIDYIRVLPSGVVLEIFTVPWSFMYDKMLIVPYRKSAPDDVTNFGFNADRGSFTANVNVSTQGASYRRVITNSKEMPIVTNPLGALVTVSNVSQILEGPLKIVPNP